jgi:hypothetical protein
MTPDLWLGLILMALLLARMQEMWAEVAKEKAQAWFERAVELEADRDHWKAHCEWRRGQESFPDDLRCGTTAFPVITPHGERAYYATLMELMR